MAAGDKRRIYMLIVAFLAVVYLMFQFRGKQAEEEHDTSVTVLPTSMPAAKPPPVSPKSVGPDLDGTSKENGDEIPSATRIDIPARVSEPDPPEPVYRGDPKAVLAEVVDARPVPGPDSVADPKGMRLEADALAYLLYKVRTTAADDPERAGAPWLTVEKMLPTDEEWNAGTHRLRGEWVKIIGTLRQVIYQPELVEEPGPSGVYQMYANFLSDAGGKILKVYTVYNDPPFSDKQDVETEGLFFKLHAFENQNGGVVAVPTVIAERLRPYAPEPTVESAFFTVVIPALLVAAGVALVLVMVLGGSRGLAPRRFKPRNRPAGDEPDEEPGGATTHEESGSS